MTDDDRDGGEHDLAFVVGVDLNDHMDLVGRTAYMLWQNAGSPQGADFSGQARDALNKMLVETDMGIDEISDFLDTERAADELRRLQPPPPPEREHFHCGHSFGFPTRDALDLIYHSELERDASISRGGASALDEFVAECEKSGDCRVHSYGLGGTNVVAVVRDAFRSEGNVDDADAAVTVEFIALMGGDDLRAAEEGEGVVLHWGVSRGDGGGWAVPPPSMYPPLSNEFLAGGDAAVAVDTALPPHSDLAVSDGNMETPTDGLRRTLITVPRDADIDGLQFTFLVNGEWRGGDQRIRLHEAGETAGCGTGIDPLVRRIIDAEVNYGSWTLMHRYNMCSDFLESACQGSSLGAESQADALSTLYIWLRFSAQRLLTWQRNYNTQPRVLSEAQHRLTRAATAAAACLPPESADWARLLLGCVGRGTNGQQVRDEILNIMHRHNIKEEKGSFMEEWHQKLHNNTTPDDIGICEAYLAFLSSGGNIDAYLHTLGCHGLDEERLRSFDRPINTRPEFYGHIKDALEHDFRHYLGILKGMHESSDLYHALEYANQSVPHHAWDYLNRGLSLMHDRQAIPAIENLADARAEMQFSCQGNTNLMYLDLALEQAIRQLTEGSISSAARSAFVFIAPLLQNLCVSRRDNEELCYCLRDWNGLPQAVRDGFSDDISFEDASKALAVTDRLRRSLGSLSDVISDRLQSKALTMGRAFSVDEWKLSLFSEEVVRGSPAFALSLVLNKVEGYLREAVDAGDWQVISNGNVVGVLVVEDDLEPVQDHVYPEPTILLAERVSGEEEIPKGVVALLTADTPDVLSHVSVRARNLGVLFASCFDPSVLEAIRTDHVGRTLRVSSSPSGDVVFAPEDKMAVPRKKSPLEKAMSSLFPAPSATGTGTGSGRALRIDAPKWSGKYAVTMEEYDAGVVGAKSRNLATLRGKIPAYIGLPPSVSIPFGVFEAVLNAEENAGVRAALQAAYNGARSGGHDVTAQLQSCREAILEGMRIPPPVAAEIKSTFVRSGIPVPANWEDAERALIGCWASKYNARAFVSARNVGLNHDAVRMAVLVQSMVPAAYAFVLHTTHPTTGDEGTLYGEAVVGLGETLVGNAPGRALAFTFDKEGAGGPSVLRFPSKSHGLFVPECGSLIFRSDSNGEDLDGYAGAGLFDSVPVNEAEERKISYSADPLIYDADFRKGILSTIANAGIDVERAMGSPQDIEGVIDADGKVVIVQTRPQML